MKTRYFKKIVEPVARVYHTVQKQKYLWLKKFSKIRAFGCLHCSLGRVKENDEKTCVN